MIDDDPNEIEFTKNNKLKAYLIKSYRKNGSTDKKEYMEIMRIINDNSNGIFNKLFK